ncbi:Nn.00g092700.m01.CDS01 [Neocucurbitaria sp. VM-36]
MPEYKVGQTVETSKQVQGLVKYVGLLPGVSTGTFLGIELSTPTGKNDGSVRGERYFECPPEHGLFIRPANVARIVSQPAPRTPAPSTPTPAAQPETPRSRPAIAAPRARPSSVVPPRTTPRASTINRRQSVAPATSSSSSTTLRPPVRKPSIASSSATSAAESSSRAESSSQPAQSGLRSGISSSTTPSTLRTSRDTNVETLQTKIRHLETQHSEDQERLREFSQIKDERDRYHNILQKLQTKCQAQHQEIVELKEQVRSLQSDYDRLSRNEQEHETDIELATLDKEMAEERAEQAETEIESLRKRLEERDLELEILRDEAELFTTSMSEEEKQEAGYYRLQHENDRLREALILLKEVKEEAEQDYKARILELEGDVERLEVLEQENFSLQERIAKSDAVIEDLREQLNAANEWEDIIGDLSTQNQEFKEALAEKDMVIRDLENLKELNDELEMQQLEEAEDLRAELVAKDNELAQQNARLSEQANTIIDNEDIIAKFRTLIVELQAKMDDAESSKLMTQAQVKDTTGRFNEVMDLNRRLRAATVQATNKEITAELKELSAEEALEKMEIWVETGSKEFGKTDSLHAYFTAKRIAFKCKLLRKLLVSTDREMGHGGRLEDALSKLFCSKAISHLSVIKNGSEQLWFAVTVLTLPQFGKFGSAYQELLTVERALDQGLNALKVDEVDFAELAGSFGRSTRIQEAVLVTHQDALATRPEDELLFRVRSISCRLEHITAIFDVVFYALHRVGDSIHDQCQRTVEHLKEPSEHVKAGHAAAERLLRTLQARRDDGMYPVFPFGIDAIIQQDNALAQAVEALTKFAEQLIGQVARYSSLTDPTEEDMEHTTTIIHQIDLSHIGPFHENGLHSLYLEIGRWTDLAAVLMNNIEIERPLAPWTQKALEVEVAEKKKEEATIQLQTLTAEHRATILKIHEREQAIATKELEIEHLVAKNRDAAAKVEDVQALQAELTIRHDKIMELEAQRRAQMLEIESLRERAARSDQIETNVAEPTTSDATARVEPAEQSSGRKTAPAQYMAMLNALRNDNRWLRRRQHSDIFHRNLKDIFDAMQYLRELGQESEAGAPSPEEPVLDVACLSDDGSEELDTSLSASGLPQDGVGHKVSGLAALTPVSLGQRVTWEESDILSVIEEEDEEDSWVITHL